MATKWLCKMLLNPTFRRWCDMMWLAITAVLLLLILEKSFQHLVSSGLAFAADLSPLIRFPSIVLVSMFTSLALIRLGALHPSYTMAAMLNYPPVWVSAVIGALVLCITCFFKYAAEFNLYSRSFFIGLTLIFIAVGVGTAFALIVEYLRNHNESLKVKQYCKQTPQDPHQRPLSEEETVFMDWVCNEHPIGTPAEDLFSHKIQARRIASRIIQEASVSIGILGPFGSGKSSLIRLVEYYLENKHEMGSHLPDKQFSGKLITCKIDGWGLTSTSVAQSILSQAIKEIGKHVDCLSVITLPENYRQAIREAKTPAGAVLSDLLHVSHDPIVQLAKLDQILAATKYRVVIFLEDLDRNTGEKILGDELPALLDRLRRLRQFCFVLAIGTEKQYSNVVVRICDYVEAVA